MIRTCLQEKFKICIFFVWKSNDLYFVVKKGMIFNFLYKEANSYKTYTKHFLLFPLSPFPFPPFPRSPVSNSPFLFPFSPFTPFPLFPFSLFPLFPFPLIHIWSKDTYIWANDRYIWPKNKYCKYTVLYLLEIYVFFCLQIRILCLKIHIFTHKYVYLI